MAFLCLTQIGISTTSGCIRRESQRVGEAINDLQMLQLPDGTAQLAALSDLHMIEGLTRYINELNKAQGMGENAMPMQEDRQETVRRGAG
eukprot:SAG22_NODE_6078_length_903_cov_1.411692_1_plen_89_part_10